VVQRRDIPRFELDVDPEPSNPIFSCDACRYSGESLPFLERPVGHGFSFSQYHFFDYPDSWPPRTLLEPGSAVHHPKTKKDLPWPYCPNLMKYRSCTDGSSTLLRNFYETRQGIVVISDVREPCPRMGTADWMVVGGGSSRISHSKPSWMPPHKFMEGSGL
jgi:hypothetical protein